ncbi:hypothetical protein TNCV_4710981 [Trichonephila clavipes]|uniref:Uncharacterized protein n=1 Tax=Trichonephila clavipes TaxID=2585209 RepID=A0A8X6RTH2_TRICX|nr:hypothetical protein TNCV_4710981 [Trichonephila clavipes]
MNETTQQQRKTTQLSSRNETTQLAAGTKQLNSAERKHCQLAVGTKQPPQPLPSTATAKTAYNRLQPPTTACTAFTAESAFSLLNAKGKKELIEWCMNEGLIVSSYEFPKFDEQMG